MRFAMLFLVGRTCLPVPSLKVVLGECLNSGKAPGGLSDNFYVLRAVNYESDYFLQKMTVE